MAYQDFDVGYGHIKVHPDWNVLEVGGGHSPCPRANTVTNYKQEENQRGKPIKNIPGARMLEMDVQDMAEFKDQEFNYSICVQVLEHVGDPVRACRELMRVSKRGYIETPAPICEQLIGWPFHRWLVYICPTNSNKLIFRKKSELDFGRMDDFFHDMFYKENPNRARFVEIFMKYQDLFITKFHWEDRFEVGVID